MSCFMCATQVAVCDHITGLDACAHHITETDLDGRADHVTETELKLHVM